MQREKWSAMGKPVRWSLMAICNVVKCLRIFTIRPYYSSFWILTTNAGVMQPMLRSPDFGTGFYMFYSDNLKNKWIQNHNSLSFYDRFYNVRTNWICSHQITDVSGSVETTQELAQPENNNTDSVPRKCPENISEDAEVICVSTKQQEKQGLKRPLSEIENTSEDIQEVPSGEKISSKKHKKVKKHKHKHDEGSKKRHESSTETPTPDVICVGESVVDKEVDDTSRNKSRKHKKHKHKHKRRQKPVTSAQPEITEVICLDDTAENIDSAKIIRDFANSQENFEKHHSPAHEEGREFLTQIVVPEMSVTSSPIQVEEIELEGKSTEISKDDEARLDEHSNRKEKKRLTKDIVNYLDGRNSETIEILDDSSCDIASEKKTTRRQKRREREKEKNKLSRDVFDAVHDCEFDPVDCEKSSKTHQKVNTETPDCIPEQQARADAVELSGVESDMDVASSPSVGGIHYAIELEQNWQNDSNEVVPPSLNNVHYVGDLEKQWQEGSACANFKQSNDFNQFDPPWKTVFPPWSAWKPSGASSSEKVNQRQQSNSPPWQLSRSTNRLHARSFHTSSDNWCRDDKQSSSESPPENSAEFIIDTTKPYSGSDAWLRRRQWEYTDYGNEVKRNGRKRKTLDFSIASYNVLAQNLIDDNPYLYDRCHAEYLRWEYRKQNLLHEISELCPDVLCLQEVNGEHYDDFFLPQLQQLGYDGLYKNRTGDKEDGCATFWKDNKFKLEKGVPVEYFKPGIRVLDRDNVALLVLLKPKGRGKHNWANLCVANTHLLFNPRRGDIKLAQAMLLMAEIEKLSFIRHQPKTGQEKYYPTLLCGDFNCEPFCDLYKFFGRGVLEYDGLLQRNIAGQEEGRFGRDMYMNKQVIPKSVGISDKCQYIVELRERWSKFMEKLQNNIKETNGADNSPAKTDGETMDLTDEATTESAKAVPNDTNADVIDITCDEISDKKSPDPESVENEAAKPAAKISVPSNPGKDTTKTEQFEEPSHSQCTGVLSHKAKFVSVYDHEHYNGRYYEKEATTHHGRANCTVDYIFYSVESRHTRTHKRKFKYHGVKEGRLRLVGKLVLASEKKLDSAGCLPNQAVSSDHTILMAKFSLNTSNLKK